MNAIERTGGDRNKALFVGLLSYLSYFTLTFLVLLAVPAHLQDLPLLRQTFSAGTVHENIYRQKPHEIHYLGLHMLRLSWRHRFHVRYSIPMHTCHEGLEQKDTGSLR